MAGVPTNAGAVFTSLTTTTKLFVALSCFAFTAAAFVSVTTVVNVFVPGPCASVGVQVITPLVSIAAPAGGSISTDSSARWPAGRCPLAVLVTVSSVSSVIVRLVCAGSTGAAVHLVAPPPRSCWSRSTAAFTATAFVSVTTVVIVLVLGPCASRRRPGDHAVGVNRRPAGAAQSADSSTRWPARSLSLAVLVTVSSVSSSIVRLVCAGSTGATVHLVHHHRETVGRAQLPRSPPPIRVRHHRRKRVGARSLRLPPASR